MTALRYKIFEKRGDDMVVVSLRASIFQVMIFLFEIANQDAEYEIWDRIGNRWLNWDDLADIGSLYIMSKRKKERRLQERICWSKYGF